MVYSPEKCPTMEEIFKDLRRLPFTGSSGQPSSPCRLLKEATASSKDIRHCLLGSPAQIHRLQLLTISLVVLSTPWATRI